MVKKLASSIYNDVMTGLIGITSTPNMSIEQLEDEIIDERLTIIKEYSLKNLIPIKDLVMAINCVPLDCKALDKCPCSADYSEPQSHFQIPQIVNDLAENSIMYIGSVDKLTEFKVYTSNAFIYHKYMRRGSEKPYVYISTTPNENNLYDGWVFNAPLLEIVSIVAVFKDPRQSQQFYCCIEDDLENYSFISNEVRKRLTEKKLRYYRQLYTGPTPNTQTPK